MYIIVTQQPYIIYVPTYHRLAQVPKFIFLNNFLKLINDEG